MADGLNIRFEDREFNRAMDELTIDSRRMDIEVLTGQAIQAVRIFVKRTRLAISKAGRRIFFTNRGRGRAGWWPSWKGLGVFSRPPGVPSRVLGAAEGSFNDGRAQSDKPFVELINEVPYIDTLDKEDNIVAGGLAERTDDMQRALDRRYIPLLARKSGR